jgi:superfamily II DNA helicase RecQ
VDEERFERLRTWRWERAEGKPAFTVAANAVLEQVLRRRPRSIEALMSIRGIGPAFCEKHGESLLATLAAMEEDSPEPGANAVPSERPAAALASLTAPT